MQIVRGLRCMCLTLFFASMNYAGVSQHIDLATKEIESLIREWNYANNSRSVASFENVYSDNLLFYTQTLSESKAIALKQNLFKTKPYFRQRITTSITYTPYTTGVIKCEFTKEVLEKSGWRSYPSYLLVSYEDNRYWIVGESDNATDKTLKYRLDIGEPMKFEKLVEKRDSASHDSSMTVASSPIHPGVDSVTTPVGSKDQFSIFAALSSLGTVTIPKGYLYVLIGILSVGGLMIFIAESKRMRRQKNIVQLQEPDEADNVIQEFKMQSVFEAFVITLFDPLFFRYRRPKAEWVFAGKVSEGETEPDLEFVFRHKETHARFAIKCLYYKNTGARELQLFSGERQQSFRNYEAEREMSLYYVLGIGGTPDDPKELYLVPSKDIKNEFVCKEQLKPYWKSGMFFYNSVAQKLQ